MGAGPIVFNYANWVAQFPQLSGVSQAAATGYFALAGLYVRNDGGGPVCDPNLLTQLLNLTTAHLAQIFSQQIDGVPNSNATTSGASAPSPLVGRIASATEGSVTVSAEMPEQAPNAAWWNQTTYGAAVWVLLKPFRLFRYIPPTKVRRYNPPYTGPYWGNVGGGGGFGGV